MFDTTANLGVYRTAILELVFAPTSKANPGIPWCLDHVAPGSGGSSASPLREAGAPAHGDRCGWMGVFLDFYVRAKK